MHSYINSYIYEFTFKFRIYSHEFMTILSIFMYEIISMIDYEITMNSYDHIDYEISVNSYDILPGPGNVCTS